ncbi:SCO family protein [Verticiella sediminum]|uniref:SCO family protein n=1 Tax=Verticiella sediminum TaxID=1247510 RepID=A0A556AKB4_9BURK|nr:SCO family protein [Verticiella sediminum]TSH93329.1 SCO family protein [Verticiella sediminum]
MTHSLLKPARRRLLAAGAAGLALPALLSGCLDKSASFRGTDVGRSDIGQNWRLPDTEGEMRSAEDFKGKVAVAFFGFIQCPDVCPTTLAELTEVKRQLGPDGERMQVLFITVDPERDTPQIIREYLDNFDGSFVGLRGDLEQLADAARAFKAFYAKVPGPGGEGYTMDHSAGLYFFDPEGNVRVYARYGQPVEDMVADVRTLLG